MFRIGKFGVADPERWIHRAQLRCIQKLGAQIIDLDVSRSYTKEWQNWAVDLAAEAKLMFQVTCNEFYPNQRVSFLGQIRAISCFVL